MPLNVDIKNAIDMAAILVAASATFRSTVGATDEADALANYIVKGDGLDTAATPNRCIVGSPGDRAWSKTGTKEWALTGGGVFLLFEFATSSGNQGDPSAAHDEFLGKMEPIVNELLANESEDRVGQGESHLVFRELFEATPPLASDPEKNQGRRYWWQEFQIQP